MRRALIAACVLCVLCRASAQDGAAPGEATPSWLLYEQGKTFAESREYGKALQAFKDAIQAGGILPEAEVAIGDVYRAEGELELARRQYEKAYNLRNALSIPSAKYDILYRLASLFEDQELYKQMEDKLLLVLQDDRDFSGPQSTLLKDQIEKNYATRGLDRVFTLYRFNAGYAAPAHAKLGWFYYRTGRFPNAIQHLLYAVVQKATEVDSFLKQRDSLFAFDSLQSFLAAAIEDPDAAAYLESTEFYRDLYYLASSTNTVGHPQIASTVWKQLSSMTATGTATGASAAKYADLARRQLRSPWVEPYLVPSSRYLGNP